MVSEEMIFKIFSFSIFLHYGFHGNQYKRAVGQKYKAAIRLFKDHFYNVLSKYLQLLGNKIPFFNFPIISQLKT